MKKLLTASLALPLILAACSSASEPVADNTEKVAAKAETKAPAAVTVETKEAQIESDVTLLGTPAAVYFDEKLNLAEKNGPGKVIIKGIQLLDLTPDEQYKEILGGKDTAHMLVIKARLKNSSKETINWSVHDSKLVVNGEQLETQYYEYPDNELLGKAAIDVEIFYSLKKPADAVKEFTWHIDRPYNPRTMEYIGKRDTQWTIKLNR